MQLFFLFKQCAEPNALKVGRGSHAMRLAQCVTLLAVISFLLHKKILNSTSHFLNGNRKKDIKRATEKDWSLQDGFRDSANITTITV